MSIEVPGKPEEKPATISEIPPIEASRGQLLRTRESIKDVVEAPLVAACEELYEKNIQTISASANAKDVKIGYGGITINYDALSPENQRIARRLGELDRDGDMQTIFIQIPISANSTLEDISRAARQAVFEFEPQTPIWLAPHVLTFAQMKKAYGISEQRYPDLKPEDLADPELGWFFDKESERFYPSEELFRKAKVI